MSIALWLTLVGVVMGFVLLANVRTPSDSRRRGGRTLGDGGDFGAISVVIPARNEEASLPNLLASLDSQTLPIAEIIVVDDGSTDRTAAIAQAAGVTVIHAPPPPEGWVGKSWACHLGSLQAVGTTLVFLDADVTVSPDGLEQIVAAWQAEVPEGLLSVQPFHATREPYEQMSAYPNLMSMMASGAFTPLTRGFAPVAFGPCLVTDHTAYRSVGGHEAVRGQLIEDVHLARTYAAAGLRVRTLAGGSAISFRMYPEGLRQLIDGWTKNLAGGPRLVSPVPLFAAVLWVVASAMVSSDVVRALATAASTGQMRWVAAAAWALMAAQMAVLLGRIGHFRWWAAPAFPVLLAGFIALFVRSTLHRAVRRSVTWHGRSVAVRVK